ncbi:MAG TPA: GNAT family N-acetyltransferase [Longimicrobiales bacterium]|nr:GNAT family N-acetyltransferase [Longimicrobiales bacterium]
MDNVIYTRRLDLQQAEIKHLAADLKGKDALAEALDVLVPDNWPPELYDEAAIKWTLDKLKSGEMGNDGFSVYYFILRPEEEGDAPVLIGVGGYTSSPVEGTVEVGYGILEQFRRRGFASEATAGFVRYAFSHREVHTVTAQTLPHLDASIGVLIKNGFEFVGDGSEAGVIRYALKRP